MSIFAAATVGDLEKKPNLLFVYPGTFLPAALELLSENNILSVPVLGSLDGNEQLLGQLDMIDVCKFVVQNFDSLSDGEDESKQQQLQRKFQKTTVSTLLECFPSNPCCPVPEDAKLSELFPLLSVYELHRVPVISGSGRVVRVVSQSDLVKFLQGKLGTSGLENRKLSTYNDVKKSVISVTQDQSVMDAFKLIINEKVSAVGVIDNDGRLIGNISATDIRSIGANATFSTRLFWSVSKFLKSKVVEFQAPKEVQSVSLDSTVGETLELVIRCHLHRVYITDQEKRPVGILSLTDLLKIIQQSEEEKI